MSDQRKLNQLFLATYQQSSVKHIRINRSTTNVQILHGPVCLANYFTSLYPAVQNTYAMCTICELQQSGRLQKALTTARDQGRLRIGANGVS